MKTKSIFNFRESDSYDTASRVSQTTLKHAMLPEVSLAMNQHRAEIFISWRLAKKIENQSPLCILSINRAKYPRIESENDDIKDGK